MAGFFPMFVRLAGRIVVVVGGGDLAVRTTEALLKCDAEVRVISPNPSRAFARFRGVPNLTVIARGLEHGDLEDALLALAVDEDPSVNLQTAREGLEWSVLVSVADELATALRTTILRNPTVTARDWDQAQTALGRYERAGGERPAALPEPPEH